LENFISEKLHTDKMNTYYSMFYYVVTSYNNNMEEESIKNLAIWALNREDVTLENIFTTIYDNVAKTVLLGHFPEERIYTLFKGFYDAGLSADVIRNYSQEGEDWYLEDILGASDV
jgi:hypothetical protein